MGFSVPHLLVVLAITILVFGTKRLRNLGGDLGGAIKSFRTSMKEGEEDTVSDAEASFIISEPDSKTKEKN